MRESNPKGVALITGAAERVGAVMARRLAGAGHAVVIHYNGSADAAEALATGIRRDGGQAAAIGADLSERDQRARLVARAAEPFGPLTILINNASVYEPDSATTLDEALWDVHFALHVEAPVFLARDFATQLPEGVEGNVINMVDARVVQPVPAYFSYHLSKTALLNATRTLAQSLGPAIRVNAIGPGPTLPERGQSREAFEARNDELLLGRGSAPDDIADAVLYLIGARSVTGQMLAVDGGIHLEWPDWADPTPRDR